MHFTDRKEGEVTVVAAGGRLDSAGAPLMEQHLGQLLAAGERRIVIDCTDLYYVSSAGLRVFLAAAKQIRNAQGGFALACLKKEVREIFDIAGFSTIISIYDAVADAARACC